MCHHAGNIARGAGLMCYRAGVAVERVYARPGFSVPDLEGAVCRAGNYHLWRRVVEVAAMLLTVKMMVTMTFRCTAMTFVLLTLLAI